MSTAVTLPPDLLEPNADAENGYVPQQSQLLSPQCERQLRSVDQATTIAHKAANALWSIQPLGQECPWPDVRDQLDSLWSNSAVPNTSWVYCLHSLEILLDLRIADEHEQVDQFLRVGTSIAASWFRSNPRRKPPSRFSWNDHATANRVLNTCAFFDYVHSRGLNTPGWMSELLSMHASFLAEPQNYTRCHNHGIFQDYALIVAASHVRPSRRSTGWRSLAERRLREQIQQTFSSGGLHLENSPGYHVNIARLLEQIRSYCRAIGKPLPGELTETIEQANEKSRTLVMPNHWIAPVGDTQRELVREDLWTDKSQQCTGGQDAIHGDAGYGMLRTDSISVFMSATHNSPIHKHCDDLSFVVGDQDGLVITDPGFLNYELDDSERHFTISWPAHNVLTCDEEMEDEASIRCGFEAFGRNESWTCLVGRSERRMLVHRRWLMLHRPTGILLVVDSGQSSRGQSLSWRRHFQFEPNVTVDKSSDAEARLIRPNAKTFSISRGGVIDSWDVLVGQNQPKRGWVARRFDRLIPAPTLIEKVQSPRVRVASLIHPDEHEGSVEFDSPSVVRLVAGDLLVQIGIAPTRISFTPMEGSLRERQPSRIDLTQRTLGNPRKPTRLHWRRRVRGVVRKLTSLVK